MGTDGATTYCAEHGVTYRTVQSLGCTPETNITLDVNDTSIKTKSYQESRLKKRL